MLRRLMPGPAYRRVASYPSARAVADYLTSLGWSLAYDDAILKAPGSPLAQPIEIPWGGRRRRIGNRFAVQPMEGWDGETDGRPSELVRRRWLRFASSGAKLIWGCEAVAVLPEARANPNQLLLTEETVSAFTALREEMVRTHRARFGSASDLVIGLQLTHSGRFSHPREKARLEPVIAYHHPVLDARTPPSARQEPLSDAEVGRVIHAFAAAARLAQQAGFDFVDLKHCHGYLGHEFLSAHTRPGVYGGCFENRTRLLREMVGAVREAAPRMEIGVRVSAYDSIPYFADPGTGKGVPAMEPGLPAPLDLSLGAVSEAEWQAVLKPYRWGFGVDAEEPWQPDLSEASRLLQLLRSLEIHLVNISAGSPYYSAHLQRPALFPPCDAYLPPEDPLVGAARLLTACRDLKRGASDPPAPSLPAQAGLRPAGLIFVSSGWSYFQNYLPHFAQAAVRAGWADFVGLGRMMLPYPELPAEVLEKGRLDHRKICRTFSDCTNGPRNGMVSGCYPLDPHYKGLPEAIQLQKLKTQWRATAKI